MKPGAVPHVLAVITPSISPAIQAGVACALTVKKPFYAGTFSLASCRELTGSIDRFIQTAAFYGEKPMEKNYTEDQGRALLALARAAIQDHLGVKDAVSPALKKALMDDAFKAKTGTFVTLSISGELRGCIGSLEGREPLVEGVKHNAVNAAFGDPRFRPLSEKELDKIHIEVSILTEPETLAYSDAADLMNKLRPGVDGVIIRQGYAGATFLPQVWEQLPDKEEFLSHLCMKAGLGADAWKRGKLEVKTYRVQCFEEGRPKDPSFG